MCGLAGAFDATGLSVQHEKVFKDLLVLAQLRGIDSAGVVVGRRFGKESYEVVRGVMNTGDFVHTPELQKSMRSSNKLLMGHARAATIGNVDYANSQPVGSGNIILTHNGTIHAFGSQAKAQGRSDSRILAEKIDKKGLEEALKDAGHGAYALVIADIKKELLCFVRNNQRTFFYMMAGTAVFWSSREEMLEFAASYNNIRDYEIKALEPGVCITFDMSGKIKKPHVSRIAEKKTEATSPPNNSIAANVRNLPAKQENNSSTRSKLTKCDADGGFYRGHDKKIVDAFEVVEMLHSGCVECNKTMTVEDDAYWYSDKTVVCRGCYRSANGLTKAMFREMPTKGEYIKGNVTCH